MKLKNIRAGLAGLAFFGLAHQAQATDYFIVVPVPNKTVSASEINVSLAGTTLPDAKIGEAYSFNLTPVLSVTGDPKYTGYGVSWAVTQGELPPGVTLDPHSGVLSGTPSVSGSWPFTISATYMSKSGAQAYQVQTLTINVALAGATLANASVGTAYSYDFKPLLTATEGSASVASNVTWSVVAGALPPGLTLNSNGTLTGTASAAGSSNFTVQASYKNKAGQQTYTLAAVSASQLYNMVNESATLSLTAPAGTVFRSVTFASFGTPSGTGPNYTLGSCNAANSVALVSAAFVGKSSGSISASDGVFGDPCYGTSKRLAVVLTAY